MALLRLSTREAAKQLTQRALAGLAGFARSLKVKYQDIEVWLDFDPEPGLADNGDLETDLHDLLEAVGNSAKAGDSCLALFIDELQHVREEVSALVVALHRTSQLELPVVMFGAGLPQLRGRIGRAKSYAERLFDSPQIGPLSPEDARLAIAKHAADQGVEIKPKALDAIARQAQCYPYFLQEWGKHVWDVAEASPISAADAEIASRQAAAALDERFVLVRFDRLTPAEKLYVRAMSQLGPGLHRSGDIADSLGRRVSSLAPTRNQLISKGMIWSPSHGDTAFTVPMFNEFLLRSMPETSGRRTVARDGAVGHLIWSLIKMNRRGRMAWRESWNSPETALQLVVRLMECISSLMNLQRNASTVCRARNATRRLIAKPPPLRTTIQNPGYENVRDSSSDLPGG